MRDQQIGRRAILKWIGGAIAWPVGAQAEQPSVAQQSSNFPDAANTGVPPGVSLAPSGSLRVTAPGQIISDLDVSGTVRISASNVTLRRCRITAEGLWVVSIDGGASGVTIEDCEIAGQGGADGASLIYIGNTGVQGPTPGLRILRCNIHGGCNGLTIGCGPVLLQDSYIHDLKTSGGGHINGIQYNGGAVFEGIIDIEHNHIENACNQTDCIMLCDFYGPCLNCTVNNNLLRGGGAYVVYSTNTFKRSPFSGIVITNNVINRNKPFANGHFYPTAFMANTFFNNTDELTGRQIPRP